MLLLFFYDSHQLMKLKIKKMMHKTFTILIFSLAFIFNAQAQDPVCIPEAITADTSIILPEPYNSVELTGGIDSTCVGSFYEQVFTTMVPSSITLAGQNFAIDSITIDLEGAIDGLPEGLDYACNPPTCVFLPETVACFVITGDVADTNPAETYDLTIRLRAFNFFFPIGAEIRYPQDIGAPNESYFIHVDEAGTCETISSTNALEKTLEASLSPNPANDFVQLNIQAESAKDVNVMIVDMLGKVYAEQAINLQSGQNSIPFFIDDLSAGIYFMTITDGKEFLTQKIVIEK